MPSANLAQAVTDARTAFEQARDYDKACKAISQDNWNRALDLRRQVQTLVDEVKATASNLPNEDDYKAGLAG